LSVAAARRNLAITCSATSPVVKFADAAVEDGPGEVGVGDAKPGGLSVKNLSDQLHMRRGECLRIAEPDDVQLLLIVDSSDLLVWRGRAQV
jgi:hypothetical protein